MSGELAVEPGLAGRRPLVRLAQLRSARESAVRLVSYLSMHLMRSPFAEAAACNHTLHVGDSTPIGTYPDAAGRYGAQDMAGNVWEVMGNGYHRYPYDGRKAKSITIKERNIKLGVIRGGSFYSNCDRRGVLVWVRIYNPPDYGCCDMGFRVCAVS